MSLSSDVHIAPGADAPTRPRPFAPGTPIGLHLRVERIVRQSPDRIWYLVHNDQPRWYTRKCWRCGNEHSPPTAQACTYCSEPLRTRRFLMSSRWDPLTSAQLEACARRRPEAAALLNPVALYRYREQLLACFPWDGGNLLLNEPAPLPSRLLLSAAFQLADALSRLHEYGVVLSRLDASHVLVSREGAVRLFDLDVLHLSDRPVTPSPDPDRPPLRDLRALAGMLQRWCAVEDEALRQFLDGARRGAYPTADAFAAAVSQFAWRRRDRRDVSVAAGQSDAGLVRDLNEDQYAWRALDDTARLYVVCDGMGGHRHGQFASEVASRALCRTVQESWAQKPPADAQGAAELLRAGIAAANQAVWAFSNEQSSTVGTTVVALLTLGDRAVVAHMGDSRAYRLRDGVLAPLTEDHSVVAAMVAAGKLRPEEARSHPKANVLLSFLGAGPEAEPDVALVDVHPGDRWLLCSDGLWGELDPVTLARVLAEAQEPRQAVRRLLRAANDAGSRDNLTAVVVDTRA